MPELTELTVVLPSELYRRLDILAIRLVIPLHTLVKMILVDGIYEWEDKADA
jgi:predicted DNA-binding protein